MCSAVQDCAVWGSLHWANSVYTMPQSRNATYCQQLGMQLHEPASQKKEQQNGVLPPSAGLNRSLTSFTWRCLFQKRKKKKKTTPWLVGNENLGRKQCPYPWKEQKKRKRLVTSMSSPLGDYMNRYLLPGKPGSSVVLGRELAVFAGEGEERSRCFFGERWGCSCVTEVFTWMFGMTRNCHQDKNFPKQNRKLLNGVKSLLKSYTESYSQ